MDVERLRDQHRAISDLADALWRAISSPQPVAVSALRWRFARELIAHLTLEDSRFYPWARGSGDAELAQCAVEFEAAMGGLANSFKHYIASWNDARIAADWDGFRAETRGLLEQLRQRIDREERVLYRMAERRLAAQND